MERNLTTGKIGKSLLLFSLPMIAGNMLQQLYNVADTLIVGKTIGPTALSAVGSAYSLMVLLTSIILGLCMGSGVVVAQLYGAGQTDGMKTGIWNAFIFITAISLLINILSLLLLDPLLAWLNVPDEALAFTRQYLRIVLLGMTFVSVYNFFSAVLRSIGNTMASLLVLVASSITNIVLDLVFILYFHMGVAGAAAATLIAQILSAVCITIYFFAKAGHIRPQKRHMQIHAPLLRRIVQTSALTAVQQSIMNFGILMVQGLVNSFGTTVMAAFAAAVKIDSFAYMPVQDFGNAFSTYVAQNYGANQPERIRKGIRSAAATSAVFCICISVLVCLFAAPLIQIFMDPSQTGIVAAGVHYLHIEGACYLGIGILFLLYGYYRAVNQPGMSVILTIASLGTRVALAYLLSATPLGVTGIWLSVPIGWALADAIGIGYYFKNKKTKAAA